MLSTALLAFPAPGTAADRKQIPRNIGAYADSVRHAAANGVGAPQIGLKSGYGKKEIENWEKQKAKYPDLAAPYDSCVTYYRAAIDQIKAIAPLTRRPKWDYSIDEINAGLRQAKNLIAVGDECVKHADPEAQRLLQAAKQEQDRKILQGRVEEDRRLNEPPAPDETPADPGPRWPGGIDPNAPVVEPGGYDPCLNPRRPPWCDEPSRLPSPTGPAASQPEPRNDAGRQSMDAKTACWPKPDLGAQLHESLRSLVEMNSRHTSNLSAVDEFFFQMAAGVRHGIEELGQSMQRQLLNGQNPFIPNIDLDPQKVAPLVRGVVDYLNNESARPEIEAALRRKAKAAAVKMHEQVMHEPGFIIGKQLPQMFIEHCVRLDSVEDVAQMVASATQEARDLNRATGKLVGIDKAYRDFTALDPARYGTLAEQLRNLGMPVPRNNLMMGEKNCHHCVKASLYERETGTHVTALDIGPLSRQQIVEDLRTSYGESRTVPPGVAPEHRQQWHEGVPYKTSGSLGLRQIFEEGGVGSDGYVYYRRAVPTAYDPRTRKPMRWGLEGHVLEIAHEPNGVQLNEPQSGLKDVWHMAERDMDLYGVEYYPLHLGGQPGQ